MAYVYVTRHLYRFFKDLNQEFIEVEGTTVAEVVHTLDQQFKGLANYLVDDSGALRKHVNIFLQNDAILDRERLSDPVSPDTQVFIFQALSGG